MVEDPEQEPTADAYPFSSEELPFKTNSVPGLKLVREEIINKEMKRKCTLVKSPPKMVSGCAGQHVSVRLPFENPSAAKADFAVWQQL